MKFLQLLAAALVAAALSSAAFARPLTARDLAMLDRVSDPQVSPDGRYVAYSLRLTDWTNNRGQGTVWILDRRSPGLGARPLAVSDKVATQPRWSPDGRFLYFLSARTGVQQIWRTDADGAVATQVTNLPVNVASYRIGPDGRTIVVAASVFPDCETLACTKARVEARRAGQVSAVTFDRLPIFIWDDWRAGERAQLFALRLDDDGVAAGEPRPLMRGFDAEAPDKPFGDDADYAVTAREVIFSGLEPGRPWGAEGPRYRLYAAPLDGSRAPRPLPLPDEGTYSKPTLSPDGSRLAFLSSRAGRWDFHQTVMVRDMATGAVRAANPGFDRSAETIRWSGDGRTLYATMADLGRTRLYAIDPAAQTTRMLTRDGTVGGVSAAGGRLVYARESLAGPAQLYELSRGAEVHLTGHNAPALRGVDLAKAEQFSFAGWNGETVYGWVLPPANARPGRKYPVAFLIHGGPHGSFGDAWSYRWNPQVWAGMGFAVVMIDFHGSAGYGAAFANSIVGHWGDRPLEDLQKGWAAALSRYPFLDGERACAIGGSFGGYMVAWIAGAWNAPWKCLVSHAGILETRTMALTTDIPGFSEYETGGAIWEKAEDFERFNPLNRLADWRTPILVIHGGRDYRVPLAQGLATFTAAQRKGVPSRLVYYPDENHWVSRPQNSVEWYREVEAWMRRWLPAPQDRD